MPPAARIALQAALVAGFAALNVWLAAGWGGSEPTSWERAGAAAASFTMWGGTAVLAGALVPRAARWVPLPAIAATAAFTTALPGDRGPSRLVDCAIQLAVMQGLVLLGSFVAARRRGTARPPAPVAGRLLLGALVLAVAAPVALGLAWDQRRAPPALDDCALSVPAGQQPRVDEFRRGLAPALALAAGLLVAPALALSRAIRGGRRPGALSLAAAGMAAAWAAGALLDDRMLEWLPGFGLLLVFGVPFTVPGLIGTAVWAARRPRWARAPAAALVTTWLSLAVTLGLVGGTIAAAGDDAWQLCMS